MWMLAAFFSALCAALSSIVIKMGIHEMDSDISTAIRTIVVSVFAWGIAMLVGSLDTIMTVSGSTWLFLILSGVCTGISWLCYYKALTMGNASICMPIEKSSLFVTILFAIFYLGEKEHLYLRLTGAILIMLGIVLLISPSAPADSGKEESGASQSEMGNVRDSGSRQWVLYALMALIFSSANSILSKIGIDGIESNLGTAVSTTVMLFMSWIFVFMRKKQHLLAGLVGREVRFTVYSGILTGSCWLCYYYAIKYGIVSIAVPLNKLSIPMIAVLSAIMLREEITPKAALGLTLITGATLLIAIFP